VKLRHIALSLCLSLGCVGCDQATKSLARDYLQHHAAVSYLGDTVRLQYAENPGAFLSVGASLPHHWGSILFTVGGAVLIVAVALYAFLALKPGWLRVAAVSLICAGGIGNIVDRIRYDGWVVDFLNVGLGSLRTGIFNVADMAIMAGVALLNFRQLRPAER
jgi:signal peptidase II